MGEIEKIEDISIEAKMEALLFVAVEAVSITQLGIALDLTSGKVEKHLNALDETLATRGLRIQTLRGRVRLTTAPELAALIQDFLNVEAISNLSPAALEALSIIAYQQPVTRPQVDSIRGVNSDGVIRSLLRKGLIQESGRAEGPGRPILYMTTPEFLQHFGLSSLKELPTLDLSEAVNGKEEQEILKG